MIPLILLLSVVTPVTELAAFVDHYLSSISQSPSYDKRRADALKIIPYVLKYSEMYGVDKWLVASTIQDESGWRPHASGGIGEVGVMQTVPKYFKDYDLKTIDGQVHAGVKHIRTSIDNCGGDVQQGINYYMTSKCKPVLQAAKWRFQRYKRVKKRFGR